MDKIKVTSDGLLEYKKLRCTVALGKGGVTNDKKEGDGATPLGCWELREVWYRKDKVAELNTVLNQKIINKGDLWCDEPSDDCYNTHVVAPHEGSCEKLYRKEDDIYDVIVPMGYNDQPAIPGKGSAIFIHVARNGYTPTEGCVALELGDLLRLLSMVNEKTVMCIEEIG